MGSDSSNDADNSEKTEVLTGDLETLNRDFQKAKEQDPCFIIIRGHPQGQRFSLSKPEMFIGRDPSVEICLSDSGVSRKHARVFRKAALVYIEDLGSSNGTVINGRRIAANDPYRLAKEDMVRMGNWILKFLPAGELEILVYGNLGDAAHMDPLTHTYNKRYLNEALEAEFKRAKTLHNDFSVVFIDLDFFKKINDTYGHSAGDYVLKEFAQLVTKNFVRPRDVFARYGGEEFVLLLTNTNAKGAEAIAEQIRLSIEKTPFVFEGTTLRVTASFGVAEVDTTMESSQTLIKAADQALYESKNQGRNRVSIA